jgi:hypothetical protein
MRGWRRTLAIDGLGAVLAGCRADEPGPRAVDPAADPEPDRGFVPVVVTGSASFGYGSTRSR